MCSLSHVQAFVNQRLPLRTLYHDEESSLAVHKCNPLEIARFYGKNYLLWAEQMQSILKHFQMEHLLSEPCPRSEAAFEKWMHADHRSNLLYWAFCEPHIYKNSWIVRFGRYGEQEFQTWPERSRRA
ncbi:hypothetical protein L3X38_013696 [Prunus dulcis]|uniref:Uncharacterized protein n=1 Tax=Prunus dulcis TaxID=3755 RepID=A0AAD4ZHA0_PRUDU|nr:hypothetical protein L3X38_013696 [Prunus dulcis]